MTDRDERAWADGYAFSKRAEGGWANTKGDRGGETYAGMSRRAHPGHPIWKILDARRPHHWNQRYPDLDPLMERFYRTEYFDAVGGFRLLAPIAIPIYDFGIHSGPYKSVTDVQEFLGFTGRDVDGKLWRLTAEAIDVRIAWVASRQADFGVATFRAAAVSIATDLIERRRSYLKEIIANDPTQEKFRKNWMGRCDSLARLVARYK